jgi:hypothetical protein
MNFLPTYYVLPSVIALPRGAPPFWLLTPGFHIPNGYQGEALGSLNLVRQWRYISLRRRGLRIAGMP